MGAPKNKWTGVTQMQSALMDDWAPMGAKFMFDAMVPYAAPYVVTKT